MPTATRFAGINVAASIVEAAAGLLLLVKPGRAFSFCEIRGRAVQSVVQCRVLNCGDRLQCQCLPLLDIKSIGAALSDISSIIRVNLETVKNRIHTACQRAGRGADSVQLVAVTKYAQWPWVEALAQFHQHFGENRPQQLAERSELLPEINWHLIGQLQRNKAKQAVQHAAMIHSVDSVKVLEKVSSVTAEVQHAAEVLLQVNVSGEDAKSGFEPDVVRSEWSRLVQMPNVKVLGFMTMAPATDDEAVIRKVFRDLRLLRDELQAAGDVPLPELSMGMSGDFEIAIEEGSTLVRIGSLLFEGLK